MRKPGAEGAFHPTNTLNGSTHGDSRPSNQSPYPSQPVRNSPPPSKRQKVEKLEDHGHTTATFQVVPSETEMIEASLTPRKFSHGSISTSVSEPLSQPTATSLAGQTNSANVSELRSMDRFLQPKSKTRNRKRKTPHSSPEKPLVGGERLLDLLPSSDGTNTEENEEADVDLVGYWNTTQLQTKPDEITIDQVGARFQTGLQKPRALERMGKAIESSKGKPATAKPSWSFKPLDDESEDELALQESGDRPSSMSKRGDVQSTKFKRSSTKQPSRKQQTLVSPKHQLQNAQEIIGEGVQVRQAVSGSLRYCYKDDGSTETCILRILEISHNLQPTNIDGEPLDKFSYITIKRPKVKEVQISKEEDCCIVIVLRAADAAVSAGAKLALKLFCREELERLVEWVQMADGGPSSVSVKDTYTGENLEKILRYLSSSVTSSHAIRDSDQTLPDDIRLIESKQARRGPANPNSTALSASIQKGPKRMTTMKTDQTGPTVPDDAARQPFGQNVRSLPGRKTRQNPARTHSFKVPSASPEASEPHFDFGPGWTVQNPDWRAAWRNSLVFPASGKNRSTVDAEDIERLNEGEYLNDNLIIFFLRFLQHQLETDQPDLAKRIYFQNTFFFDKLKPTRSNRSNNPINYESVKGWTSKVDLFTKDYIIVPINEYNHWYVAIIYNAPKLITRSEASEAGARVTNVSPTPEVEREIPNSSGTMSSEQERPTDNSNKTQDIPDGQDDMVANLRRMSIDSAHNANGHADKLDGPEPANQHRDDHAKHHETDIVVLSNGVEATSRLLQNADVSDEERAPQKGVKPGNTAPIADQPRIITLDSLGLTHSPACVFLRKYLKAEAKDKKGRDIEPPIKIGLTAKGVPEQKNHCDCGLFLLGYIREFLKNPDEFVQNLLRGGKIGWDVDPIRLRAEIRELLFSLQNEQKSSEDAAKELKRQAALAKKRSSQRSSQEAPAREFSSLPSQPTATSHRTRKTPSPDLASSNGTLTDEGTNKKVNTSSVFDAAAKHGHRTRLSDTTTIPGLSNQTEASGPERYGKERSREGSSEQQDKLLLDETTMETKFGHSDGVTGTAGAEDEVDRVVKVLESTGEASLTRSELRLKDGSPNDIDAETSEKRPNGNIADGPRISVYAALKQQAEKQKGKGVSRPEISCQTENAPRGHKKTSSKQVSPNDDGPIEILDD